MNRERIILRENFDRDGGVPDAWWVEGGQRVWVEAGRLHVKADAGVDKAPACPEALRGSGVCTVWNKMPFGGDVRVTFDAHVVGSTIDANNINLFLFYSDPSGAPLFDTRDERRSAGYDLYHNLNGYIVTFLNDTETMTGQSLRARLRLRRCPGFKLVAETFGYHCRRGVTYHVEVVRRGGRITYAVDGHVLLDWAEPESLCPIQQHDGTVPDSGTVPADRTDPEPLKAGYLGFRTYRTDLWWASLRVTALD